MKCKVLDSLSEPNLFNAGHEQPGDHVFDRRVSNIVGLKNKRE